MPTLTPAEVLASAYTSKAIGEHTGSSQDGTEKMKGISAGLRLSVSGSSSASLPTTAHEETTTRSTETMKASWKDGGMDAAGTDPQTIYSNTYTNSLKKMESSYTHATSPQTTTQPTAHREANMDLRTSSYQQSLF
ncbi:hypothetical protein VKT23_012091 [Stygiomarasmius scandens]|uniref:Uncharacterized protein n=1 Tax=Marasmiellus scandens TaxID=2682957 RepID=A0ABR1JA93_9AGAR